MTPRIPANRVAPAAANTWTVWGDLAGWPEVGFLLRPMWFTSGMSERAVERDRLILKFDGPAVADHTIDVRELAPSLLALADLYTVAHRLVGDGASLPPALDVRATDEGSFIADLLLYFQGQGSNAADLLTSTNMVATVTGLQLVEYVSHALRWALYRHRARGAEIVTRDYPEPGQIRVQWANGDSIECPIEAQALVESMDFTRTAARVFDPVRRPGITDMELGLADQRPEDRVAITRGDLGAFNTLETDDDIVSDNTREVVLTLDNLAFKPGNKWRVNDGTSSFWATLHDLDFAQQFAAGEVAFSAGDTLLVQLRDVQLRSPSRALRMEHYILRVMEHRRREEDTPFDFDEN